MNHKQIGKMEYRKPSYLARWTTAAAVVLLVHAVNIQAAAKAADKTIDNNQNDKCTHFQLCGVNIPVDKDGVHDPNGQAIKIFQAPAAAMNGFPRTETGVINWVKVLEDGLIEPRTGLLGTEKMYSVDFDVIFKNTASMPYVRFPHKPHTMWLTCANCHPKIFLPERGKNHITMAAIMSGEYCGVCHGKVAFPPLECTRCHKVPRESTGLR